MISIALLINKKNTAKAFLLSSLTFFSAGSEEIPSLFKDGDHKIENIKEIFKDKQMREGLLFPIISKQAFFPFEKSSEHHCKALLLMFNLVNHAWINIDCNVKIVDKLVCEISKRKVSISNNTEIKPNIKGCPHLSFAKTMMCFTFLWLKCTSFPVPLRCAMSKRENAWAYFSADEGALKPPGYA